MAQRRDADPALALVGFVFLLATAQISRNRFVGVVAPPSSDQFCLERGGLYFVVAPEEPRITVHLFNWIPVGSARARGAARRSALDHDVSVRQGISALIHLTPLANITTKGLPKFFLYLNLFVFSCCSWCRTTWSSLLGGRRGGSFLLAGGYYLKRQRRPAQKAFLYNRIGDMAC